MADEVRVTFHEAVSALEANIDQLTGGPHKIFRNMNVALLYLVQRQDRMDRELDLLHSRIGPILKMIADDYEDARQILGKSR